MAGDLPLLATWVLVCDDCGGEIVPGQRYHLDAAIVGGQWESHKRCGT